jgi:integrase
MLTASSEMMEVVRSALQAQRGLASGSELIFPSADDTPRSLNNIRKRKWPKALERAGLDERVIYQLGHTYASLSLEFGDSIQHVAAQLGHTSIKMVVSVYSRWLRRPESSALTKLDTALCLDDTSKHTLYPVSTLGSGNQRVLN